MKAEVLGYLQFIRVRAATTTYKRKEWQIGSFLQYLESVKKNISEVGKCDVEEYLQSRESKRQARQAACTVIREFYDYVGRCYPDLSPAKNPAAEIAFKPDTSVRLFKVPSESTMEELFSNLSNVNGGLSLRNRLLVELAYGSGLRRTELSRLNIEDIDFESNTVQVLGKGDKSRIVPLTWKSVSMLREYLIKSHVSRGPLLRTYRGHRLKTGSVGMIFHEKIGMRTHQMRHACATHMLKNGCNLRYIQELLGHNRLSTTYIYTAVEKSTLREVVSLSHPRAKNP